VFQKRVAPPQEKKEPGSWESQIRECVVDERDRHGRTGDG